MPLLHKSVSDPLIWGLDMSRRFLDAFHVLDCNFKTQHAHKLPHGPVSLILPFLR